MLSHLSTKFISPPNVLRSHEPRAALFLNRFTRTLAIMYATTALSSVLGVSAEEAKGKSFYECIQENCLHDAIRCLEGAKANDSIAYLRFWFRDPRQASQRDENMHDVHSSDEEDDGGVHLNGNSDSEGNEHMMDSGATSGLESRSSSNTSSNSGSQSSANIFGERNAATSSASSMSTSGSGSHRTSPQRQTQSDTRAEPLEIEAVVSCTSDGLVVILRRARPIVPPPNLRTAPPVYANGLFASPWAAPPIMPSSEQAYGLSGSFLPEFAVPAQMPSVAQPFQPIQGSTGPPMDEFMNSIREVAVFAWSLTGINGAISQYGRGSPTGESQPPGGMPVWDPNSGRGDASPSLKGEYRGAPVDQLNTARMGKYSEPGLLDRQQQLMPLSDTGQRGDMNGHRWL
jgi:hypothetical protein